MILVSISQAVKQFYEHINQRDVGQMRNYLKEEAQFLFPKSQPLSGKEKILRFFQVLFLQYPQLSFEVRRVVAEGDSAMAHWVNQGVDRKKQPYENEGVTLFEFQDGQIIFMSDFFKDTGKF
jgi:ketosteroid isomerase-like protein